jgi:hypothetical protein
MAEKKLTPKETIIVERKVKATMNNEPQRSWAQEIYPNASQAAAEVEVSKNLNKPNVKEAIEEALIAHGITMHKAVAPIADGLTATKEQFTENGVIETKDHATRLKASAMALKLMGAEQKAEGGNTINFINSATFNSKKYIK